MHNARDSHQIQSVRWYRASQDLLSPLLDDTYEVEMIMKTLDIMSLDHLNHQVGAIHSVEELMMRMNHLNIKHNQIPIPPLRGEAEVEAEAVIEFHIYWFVCIKTSLLCYWFNVTRIIDMWMLTLWYCDMTDIVGY